MKFGLSLETINKINSVFLKLSEVEEVIIYGSRAKGNFRSGSDIDISLKGKNLNGNVLNIIIGKIDDLNTPYLFDISIFEDLKSPELTEHINRVGQVFYHISSRNQ